MRRGRLALAVAIGLCALPAAALDWPQWRGPQRDGISQETGLLKVWPKEGPKLVWQVNKVGFGYSTPAVAGDRIYLLGNTGKKDEFVVALNAQDGQQIWKKRIGVVGPNIGPQYPGARGTPTVDGEYLYAIGSNGDLVCLETATGNIHWHKDLRTDFGGKPGFWAYSESPLIDGTLLVCTPGGSDATMVALNKQTGDVIWKSPIPGADTAGYASVAIAEVGGVKQYVQFMQKGLVGVEAKTGKFLWRYEKTAKASPANIPTPLVSDAYVYSASGYGGGGLVELKPEHGSVKIEQVYYSKKLPNAIGGAVQVGGFLYGTNSQGLMCADFKTGKLKWQDRCVGSGSICYADGCLYVHGEQNNSVALVEATSEAYHKKGEFTPPNTPGHSGRGPKAWAYPGIANGHLFIRDLDHLWCYDLHSEGGAK
jgi:outer membrane protein assembly factor BamB